MSKNALYNSVFNTKCCKFYSQPSILIPLPGYSVGQEVFNSFEAPGGDRVLDAGTDGECEQQIYHHIRRATATTDLQEATRLMGL